VPVLIRIKSRAKVILSLALASLVLAGGVPPVFAITMTAQGYRAYQGGGGAIDCAWTTGNLGNTWDEGEWVPYKIAYSNLDPGLLGLDSIVVSYDFTSGTVPPQRFMDLVRSIQVGTVDLGDTRGWVGPDGNALPVSTREEIEAAQNHVPENVWSGFTLMNLPEVQVNRTESGGEDVPPGEERHMFKIFKSDLLAAGIGIDDTTLVIYFQMHESRTLVWNNQLQAGYDNNPADAWGGYLYGMNGWPSADPVRGAGYVPGSSGHLMVEIDLGVRSVPIPIPQPASGALSGSKWSDDDGDGVWERFELQMSGWRVHACAVLEGLDFVVSTLTDSSGDYSFTDLSLGRTWFVKEDVNRHTPPETGYGQSFPGLGAVRGLGTGIAVTPPPLGAAPIGWEVELTEAADTQDNLDFGNVPMAGIEADLQEIQFGFAGPNPFIDEAVIIYGVRSPSKVHLGIWTVEGKLVRTLVNSDVAPGRYQAGWNGRTESGRMAEPGIYFCRLKAGDTAKVLKMVLATR